jgi:signal transduction histidine kinase
VGTSLAVIITPPWWKTTWFSIGLWATALLSLGGTIRYVERRKLKKRIAELEKERAVARERARISQDMHDEVGSSLSEIAILSELAKKRPDEAGGHVEEISERTAELIDNVSEIVWAMNPKNDTLDNLVAHLRRHSVKYMSLAEIHCSISAPDIIPAYYVTAEVRRNVFLVVKEALHNIVKHSGASEVTIGVALTELKMETSICDNGRGFVSGEERGSGNGLLNMRKRMADIGGEFWIESTPGAGTRITIVAPLTDARRSP